MLLAFSASQTLNLAVESQMDRLPAYLNQEERVVKALLDADQLERLGPGQYRYTVTTIQVFQLRVKPVVTLSVVRDGPTLVMRAVDAQLEGLGMVDDFKLSLESVLEASSTGLEGSGHSGGQRESTATAAPDSTQGAGKHWRIHPQRHSAHHQGTGRTPARRRFSRLVRAESRHLATLWR